MLPFFLFKVNGSMEMNFDSQALVDFCNCNIVDSDPQEKEELDREI
jgi:hypothetical protein